MRASAAGDGCWFPAAQVSSPRYWCRHSTCAVRLARSTMPFSCRRPARRGCRAASRPRAGTPARCPDACAGGCCAEPDPPRRLARSRRGKPSRTASIPSSIRSWRRASGSSVPSTRSFRRYALSCANIRIVRSLHVVFRNSWAAEPSPQRTRPWGDCLKGAEPASPHKSLEPLDMAHSCATVVGMPERSRIVTLFGASVDTSAAAPPVPDSPYSAAAEVEPVDISDEVVASLQAQFGNGRVAGELSPEAAADAWLGTPNPTFGGLCPKEFLKENDATDKQQAFLNGVLSSLEDGAFS